MVLTEVKKRLSRSKLFVYESYLLDQVIESLAKLGYQVTTRHPFIFIDENDITRSTNDPNLYIASSYKEIGPEDIINIFKYTPFTCILDVIAAIREHGAWIRLIGDETELSAIVDIDTYNVTIIEERKLASISFENLLNSYVFEDGTPTGILNI